MRINRNSRRNAYRNAMRTNASRRRLNSSKDTDALIKEAVNLQPEYNTGSYIRKNMSEDLYYFCVNLMDRAYKTIDTYGYWVSPAFMDDFGKPTEIHESETNSVLTNISLEDELEYVVSLLADGYTPDTVVTELIDWYLDKANSDTASRTSVRTNSNRRRHLNCSATTEAMADYKLAIAKEVAQATNQIVIAYQNEITRALRQGEIQLPMDHDINLLRYDRDIDFAEDNLTEAIFNFAVEAATFDDNNPAKR